MNIFNKHIGADKNMVRDRTETNKKEDNKNNNVEEDKPVMKALEFPEAPIDNPGNVRIITEHEMLRIALENIYAEISDTKAKIIEGFEKVGVKFK